MTHAEIITTYHATAGAEVYALGFRFERALYVARLTFDQLSAYFKNDRASSKRGGFLKIRIIEEIDSLPGKYPDPDECGTAEAAG